MYFKTHAVILRSAPVGDYDFWLRAASAEWGLLNLRLRGARRPGARLKFLKEPGIYVDLQIYGKPSGEKTAQLLTGTILESFPEWRESYAALKSGLELLRFSETFMTLHDPKAEEKFCLILETLSRLSRGFSNLEGLGLSFKLKMLDLSGWRLSSNEKAAAAFREELLALEAGRLDAVNPQSLGKLSTAVSSYVEGLTGSAAA